MVTACGAQAADDPEFRDRYQLPITEDQIAIKPAGIDFYELIAARNDEALRALDAALGRSLTFAVTGMPFVYRPPRPQLPAGQAADRRALPWGDSAYTSIRFPRWLPGGTALDPDTGWMYGPPSNGLTPSSEGPRRAAEALTRTMRKQHERWARERRPQWEAVIGDRPWNPPHLPFEPGTRIGWQDEHGVVHTGTVDDQHPIGSDGWEMHVTWDRDEDR
ncbi:hypothetical protein IU459_11920 [Nocardia amamiensis]|uniref:Uncharacterized protein n=1 Tax=Nocardia amamiensis TaxID=404578 RepID=A0ABS0CR27_9NOCA|nr:hypothetical protein [Nocardia amamiensis]MBF6298248.1 hypothetical protein [Nocardia amamiensis]